VEYDAFASFARFGKRTIVLIRIALCIATVIAALAPARAADSMLGLAPADEYFGRYNLSVLGIANTIRDAGARIDAGTDPGTMLTGPLSFVTDAIHGWEQKYPSDPWIAKDLLALEAVDLRVLPAENGLRLAHQTEAWLIADYPNSSYAATARLQLATAETTAQPAPDLSVQPAPFANATPAAAPALPSYASPWERFAALRAPLPPAPLRYYRLR